MFFIFKEKQKLELFEFAALMCWQVGPHGHYLLILLNGRRNVARSLKKDPHSIMFPYILHLHFYLNFMCKIHFVLS